MIRSSEWQLRIRLGRTCRGIAGGRHARRPCFDFGTPTYRGLSSVGRLRDVACPVSGGLARHVVSGTRIFLRDIGIARVSTVVMALNKLSIDKVELADKRVLIRYVSDKILSRGEESSGHADVTERGDFSGSTSTCR